MNYYAQAIDIVTNSSVDFRDLMIEVAKRHPKAIVEAAKLAGVAQTEGHESWEWKVIPLLKDHQKIHAIKICRSMTGMPLKEAKEAVEAFMQRIGF